MKSDTISVESGVSQRTKEPFVTIRLGLEAGQFDIKGLDDLIRNLMEARESAIMDAMFFKFAKEVINLDDSRAGQMVAQFRKYREKLEKEGKIND